MNLYSKDGAYPEPLPQRVRLSDFSTRTDAKQYANDDEVLADLGFVLAPPKPTVNEWATVSWDGAGWVVTQIERPVLELPPEPIDSIIGTSESDSIVLLSDTLPENVLAQ